MARIDTLIARAKDQREIALRERDADAYLIWKGIYKHLRDYRRTYGSRGYVDQYLDIWSEEIGHTLAGVGKNAGHPDVDAFLARARRRREAVDSLRDGHVRH